MKIIAIALAISALVLSTSAIPFVRRDVRYKDLSNDFSCAKANQAQQANAFPGWSYNDIAPTNSKQPIYKAWEPILEPVERCTGLDAGWTKQFSFLVVLDASWVRYYNENTNHFAAQGYNSLLDSPRLMIDRVSYLFDKQFGAKIKASNVVAFSDLGEACATNNKYTDDGSDLTSTTKRLAKAGVSPLNTDAGTMRIGVGSYTPNQYCHSHSPIPGLCNKNTILENHRKPFASDGSGKLDYVGVRVLAHELAHFFGVCPNSNAHCLNRHSINELADIQVWDGTPAVNARSQGMFRKFMTTCSPLYEDTVCKEVKGASATCGVHVPPPTISGEYVQTDYGARANNWHYVTISEVKEPVFKWTNRAGVSWTLTRDKADAELFHVSSSSPYYSRGHKTSRIATKTTLGVKTITGIYGPWNELYKLKSEVDPWDPSLCPFGNVDATCWGDSAYQKCPYDRQGAYNAVIAKKSGGQKAMHNVYVTLTTTGSGCTKAP